MSACRALFGVLLLTSLACATRPTTPVDTTRPIPSGGSVTLTVQILGLETEEGSVAVALFDSAANFDQRTGAVASQSVAPRNGQAAWTVEDLPAGTYAVAVYHDLNDNGELDRPTLGPPSEPYGFSNGARSTFGPPTFKSAAVELPAGRHTLEIRVR